MDEKKAELCVVDEREAAGLRPPFYQYRNRRTANCVELYLAEIGDATPYPYLLQGEQFKLSRLLSARLDAHPHGRSLFQRRILGIAQDADGVTVSVESPLAIEQYRADYVIAADGANSTIRDRKSTRLNSSH